MCHAHGLSGPAIHGFMHPLLPSLAAAGLYAGATLYQGLRFGRQQAPDKRLLGLLGALALVAHAFSLTLQLLPGAGLNLDFFNASSLIACAVIALTLLGSAR